MYASQQIKLKGDWVDYGFIENIPDDIPLDPGLGCSIDKYSYWPTMPRQVVINAIKSAAMGPLDLQLGEIKASFTERLRAVLLFRAGLVIREAEPLRQKMS